MWKENETLSALRASIGVASWKYSQKDWSGLGPGNIVRWEGIKHHLEIEGLDTLSTETNEAYKVLVEAIEWVKHDPVPYDPEIDARWKQTDLMFRDWMENQIPTDLR